MRMHVGDVWLAEWGGALEDKSYKYAGSLTVTGPFDTDDEAWEFARLLPDFDDDGIGHEWYMPTGFGLLYGTIERGEALEDSDPIRAGSGGVCSPAERLGERLDWFVAGGEDIPDAERRAFERWFDGPEGLRRALDAIEQQHEVALREAALRRAEYERKQHAG